MTEAGRIRSSPPPPLPPLPSKVSNLLVSKLQMDSPLSLILAGLVLILLVSVVVYLRRMGCNNFSSGETTGRRLRFLRHRSTHRGLDPAVIDTFPVFVYSDVKALKHDTLECSVCLHEFEEEERIKLLPICCHVFHPDCIDAWLAFRTTCPLCRCNLERSTTKPVELQTQADPNTTILADSSVPLTSPPAQGAGNDAIILDMPVVAAGPSSQITHTPHQKTPRKMMPSSTPRRSKIVDVFNRSHSTGHSLVQQDCERFTLRLPEDAQKRLVDLSLSRGSDYVHFTPERSSVNGYRTRPRLLATPPMSLTTCGSSKDGTHVSISTVSKNMLKSVKSPLSLFCKSKKDEDAGERSFAYLRSNPSS